MSRHIRSATHSAPRSRENPCLSPRLSTFDQLTVCRAIAELGRAVAHETGRRGSSTTSRRCAVGPAAARSCAVRCACRAHQCCLRVAEHARLRAPQWTVLAMTYESARDIWLYRGLQLMNETEWWGSWRVGLAARSAGATFVSSAIRCWPHRFPNFCGTACSDTAMHDGSSVLYVCFVCLSVDIEQNSVSAPLARPHLMRDYSRVSPPSAPSSSPSPPSSSSPSPPSAASDIRATRNTNKHTCKSGGLTCCVEKP